VTNDNAPLGWPELIGFMGRLRQDLAQVKPEIYPLTPPYLAAVPDALDAVENELGFPLDALHRDFLGFADGWVEFYRDVYLLGTSDLRGGQAMSYAQQLLDVYYDEGSLPPGYPAKDELLPIAVGTESIDLFVVWLAGPTTAGGHPVVWLAGEEVERFANFREFFLSVYQYLKNALDRANAES
jgi:hypothetical protein